MCNITNEEWDQFIKEYYDVTPCQEFGACEFCPFNEENDEE